MKLVAAPETNEKKKQRKRSDAQNEARVVDEHGIAIQTRGLNIEFTRRPGAPPVRVLEGVDLEIRRGEFVCIVGPSGCGKSTLLNAIAGFVHPGKGEVRVEGKPVTGPDPRRILVFQENGVFPWATVEENIRFGISGKPKAEQNDLISHYVAMVGLMGFERCYPRELSGGMRQRVEIARALAANPDIIYMDEPFGALDYLTRLRMRADLVRLWEAERKTILFVTHDIEEAVQLADRVFVMSARPSTVKATVTVDLPRPRDTSAPEYIALRDLIMSSIEFGSAYAPEAIADPGKPPRKQTVEFGELPPVSTINPCGPPQASSRTLRARLGSTKQTTEESSE